MPRYLILSQYTPDGRRLLRAEGYSSRLEVGRQSAEAMGGTLEALYYVRPGRWDQVVVGDLSQDTTFRLAASALSSGAYQDIEFLRLYEGPEADELAAADIAWTPPGSRT